MYKYPKFLFWTEEDILIFLILPFKRLFLIFLMLVTFSNALSGILVILPESSMSIEEGILL